MKVEIMVSWPCLHCWLTILKQFCVVSHKGQCTMEEIVWLCNQVNLSVNPDNFHLLSILPAIHRKGIYWTLTVCQALFLAMWLDSENFSFLTRKGDSHYLLGRIILRISERCVTAHTGPQQVLAHLLFLPYPPITSSVILCYLVCCLISEFKIVLL